LKSQAAWCAGGDAVEVVDVELDAGLARERQQVQTALVEPPLVAIAAIAFSSPSR
jgi:hypothetical protein